MPFREFAGPSRKDRVNSVPKFGRTVSDTLTLCQLGLDCTRPSYGDNSIDGHVRIYPPAGLREEEIADIEGKLADRCVDILVEKGVFICSAVYD